MCEEQKHLFSNKFIECDCHAPEHLLEVTISLEDKPEFSYVMIGYYLNQFRPWYKRLCIAVKYVLGIGSCDSHFDGTLLSVDGASKLRNLCKQYEEHKSEMRSKGD